MFTLWKPLDHVISWNDMKCTISADMVHRRIMFTKFSDIICAKFTSKALKFASGRMQSPLTGCDETCLSMRDKQLLNPMQITPVKRMHKICRQQ